MSDPIKAASQIYTRSGIVTSAGTLLAPNDKRSTLLIQNLNTAPAFIKFGANASNSDFDFVLASGMSGDDGLGGIFLEDVLSYTGEISVAGTSVRITATEL